MNIHFAGTIAVEGIEGFCSPIDYSKFDRAAPAPRTDSPGESGNINIANRILSSTVIESL